MGPHWRRESVWVGCVPVRFVFVGKGLACRPSMTNLKVTLLSEAACARKPLRKPPCHPGPPPVVRLLWKGPEDVITVIATIWPSSAPALPHVVRSHPYRPRSLRGRLQGPEGAAGGEGGGEAAQPPGQVRHPGGRSPRRCLESRFTLNTSPGDGRLGDPPGAF